LVRAFLPQSFSGNLNTNTNFPPQSGEGGIVPPTVEGALVQTGTSIALVQTGTDTALVQTDVP